MSKEEFKKLKQLCDSCDECIFPTCEQCEISWTDIQAIKVLLDKYNKQKEEIEKLKEHNEELAKFILNSGLEIIKSDKKDMIIDKDKFAKFKIE